MLKSIFKISIIIFSFKNLLFEAATHGLVFLESNLLTQNYLEFRKLVRVFGDGLSIPISAYHLVYPRYPLVYF